MKTWISGARVIGIATIAAFSIVKADAHEWYDADCCNKMDCREALPDEVKGTAEGYIFVPNGELFKFGDERLRPSRDANTHVCPVWHWENSVKKTRTRCIYIPVSM